MINVFSFGFWTFQNISVKPLQTVPGWSSLPWLKLPWSPIGCHSSSVCVYLAPLQLLSCPQIRSVLGIVRSVRSYHLWHQTLESISSKYPVQLSLWPHHYDVRCWSTAYTRMLAKHTHTASSDTLTPRVNLECPISPMCKKHTCKIDREKPSYEDNQVYHSDSEPEAKTE